MSLTLPSQVTTTDSVNYPIEVCGSLTYTFEIEIDRITLNFDYGPDPIIYSAFFIDNDSRGITIEQVDTTTIKSGQLKVETNNYEYVTIDTCLGSSPDQDCVYETSYKFKLSA